MDLNLSYSLVSFLVGAASGFQFINGKYGESPFRAAGTRPGLAYLGIRGVVASVAFVALYETSVIRSWLTVWALITGASAEILLRTKIFVFERQNPGGVSEDIMLGPLNLVIFFQDFFLKRIKVRLSIVNTRKRMKELRRYLPKDLTFEKLCERVKRNREALDDEDEKERVRSDVEVLEREYKEVLQSGRLSNEVDELYQEKLGYKLLKMVGTQKFRSLVGQPAQTAERAQARVDGKSPGSSRR